MNCSQCNATTIAIHGQTHSHCRVCDTYEFPTEIQSAEDSLNPTGRLTDFKCPKCNMALEVGALRNSIDVCFCHNCRGFVIDNLSLGDLITELRGSYQGDDDKPTPVNPADLDARHPCPACQDPMDAHPYYGPGNVVIDTCRHCTLAWFDHGELARIVRAPGKRPEDTSGGNLESAALKGMFDAQCQKSGHRATNTTLGQFLFDLGNF